MMSSPQSLYLKILVCYLSDGQSAYGVLHLLRLMSNLMHLDAASTISNLAEPPAFPFFGNYGVNI